jgi:FKBP-type peptidyl-prolyl cis-trans isomerase 2
MKERDQSKPVIFAAVTLFTCLGLLSQQSLATDRPMENSRISHGSSVTLLIQMTVPGEQWFEVNNVEKFVQGQHQLPPALEQAVSGMKTGDEKKVELSEEEAFGPYDAKKRKTVPREELPAWAREGDRLQDFRTGQQVTVAQLSDSSAVVDYNHPLAGKPIVLKIKVVHVDNPS